MRQTLEFLSVAISVAGGVFLLATRALSLLEEPLYLVGVLSIGLFISLAYSLIAWFQTSEQASPIIDQEGKSHVHRSHVHPKWRKWLWTGGTAVWAIAIVIVVAKSGGELTGLATASEFQFARLRLVRVFDEGEESREIPEGVGLAFSTEHESGEWRVWDGAETAMVSLWKRPRVPWIQIESVRAIVTKYEPNPGGHPVWLLSNNGNVVPPGMFAIDLDKPSKAQPDTWIAKLLAQGGEFEPWVPAVEGARLFTDDEMPVNIVTKINAKSPGIYTYVIEIEISYKASRQVVRAAPRTCCFLRNRAGDVSMRPSPNAPTAIPQTIPSLSPGRE